MFGWDTNPMGLGGFQLFVAVEEPVRGVVRRRGGICRGAVGKAVGVGGGTGTIVGGSIGDRIGVAVSVIDMVSMVVVGGY